MMLRRQRELGQSGGDDASGKASALSMQRSASHLMKPGNTEQDKADEEHL